MAERNYMNYNEVFPILDLIGRATSKGKGVTYDNSEGDGETQQSLWDTSNWEVETFEVIRDTENTIDPNTIKQIFITYVNGATDTITLIRGLTPPVDKSVQDYEYINNLMIVAVSILTEFEESSQEALAVITKENGYGNFQRVDITYSGDLSAVEEEEDHDHDTDDEEFNGIETEGYKNPNDFYTGNETIDDEDEDDGNNYEEDFADTEYDDEDELEMPESGWADEEDPSDPTDYDVGVSIEIEEGTKEYDEDVDEDEEMVADESDDDVYLEQENEVLEEDEE